MARSIRKREDVPREYYESNVEALEFEDFNADKSYQIEPELATEVEELQKTSYKNKVWQNKGRVQRRR